LAGFAVVLGGAGGTGFVAWVAEVVLRVIGWFADRTAKVGGVEYVAVLEGV